MPTRANQLVPLRRRPEPCDMFDEFILDYAETSGAQLRFRNGGSGPPLLLLHGHPRTHTTWHRVAPLLARSYTVICPDLRGFGLSSKPADSPDHAGSSKRAKARDCVELMLSLGFPRFAVAGHDRGSYTAFRAAMDHPDAIAALAVLDGVPILEALEHCRESFARKWWHWFFFAQPDKPERAILADPDAWYGGSPMAMGEANYRDFHRAIHDPDTVHGMIEDYRAGLAIDQSTTQRTAAWAGRCSARHSVCGRAATISKSSTATCSRSGVPGRQTCAAAPSTAATIWPKRRLSSSLRHCCASSARSATARLSNNAPALPSRNHAPRPAPYLRSPAAAPSPAPCRARHPIGRRR